MNNRNEKLNKIFEVFYGPNLFAFHRDAVADG